MASKALKTTPSETAPAVTEDAISIVVSALNALRDVADTAKVTADISALYEGAVQLAQKQATALERIANFEFASDELRGPAHGAIDEMRKIASDARGA